MRALTPTGSEASLGSEAFLVAVAVAVVGRAPWQKWQKRIYLLADEGLPPGERHEPIA
ncbi:hypothetical protein [Streptomyces sp. CA-132043]|uniref:hypothetical protein n=1 Tax=Streptomyces sp. CA-132043 TaxID=3240048 RepID=UPI003D911297